MVNATIEGWVEAFTMQLFDRNELYSSNSNLQMFWICRSLLLLCFDGILPGTLIVNGPPTDALSFIIIALSTCGVFPQATSSSPSGGQHAQQRHSASFFWQVLNEHVKKDDISILWATGKGIIFNLKHSCSTANAFFLFFLLECIWFVALQNFLHEIKELLHISC